MTGLHTTSFKHLNGTRVQKLCLLKYSNISQCFLLIFCRDFVSLQTLVSHLLFFLCTNRSGRPTYFSAVFNTHSPAVKQSWISNLQMAKLALGTSHCLFLNYLLCMTVSVFITTFIIKAAWESQGFTLRFLECFTSQPISCDSLSHHVICAPIFSRWGQSTGLVLCRGWWESDQKAEASSLASTDACGHVKAAGIQGQTVVLPQSRPVLALVS